MNDLRIGTGAFFDRGIDSITFKAGDAHTNALSLASQKDLPPSDQISRPQLEKLLDMPNLESFLEDAIRPDLADRELLMPGKFRQTLDSTLSHLQKAGNERQSSGDAEGAKVINRASRLLAEEASLRELVQMYRSALYQG
jgi:type III secretion protein X